MDLSFKDDSNGQKRAKVIFVFPTFHDRLTMLPLIFNRILKKRFVSSKFEALTETFDKTFRSFPILAKPFLLLSMEYIYVVPKNRCFFQGSF